MAKKELTKDDIYKKLDVLKTNEAKIRYLDKIRQRKKMLSEKTRDVIYNVSGEIYYKAGFFGNAGDFFKEAGREDTAKDCYEKEARKREEKDEFANAEHMWIKAGQHLEVIEMYNRASNKYDKLAKWYKEEAERYKKLAENYRGPSVSVSLMKEKEQIELRKKLEKKK